NPTRDALADPEIVVQRQEVAVARQHLLADLDHLLWRQTGIDAQVAQRAVEPGNVFGELERPAGKGAGHVEGGIAIFEAAVAERDHHLALGEDLAVEVGDALVCLGIGTGVAHWTPPRRLNNGARVSANSSTAPMRRSRSPSPKSLSARARGGVYTSVSPACPAFIVRTLLLKVPACWNPSLRRGSNHSITAAFPPNAPKLMPPPTYLPSVVRSGRM